MSSTYDPKPVAKCGVNQIDHAFCTADLPEQPEDPLPPRKRVTTRRGAAATEDVPDVLQPSAPYNTRATNRGRHPGIDVGLNWKQERRVREAAAEEKADRAKTRLAQKNHKAAEDRRVTKGIQELARLEAGRDAEDMQDAAYLEATTTARGYHQQPTTTKASTTRGIDHLFPPSSDDGSEFEMDLDEAQQEEDEGSDGEVEPEEPEGGKGELRPQRPASTTKVCIRQASPPISHLTLEFQVKKSAKERVLEKRVKILGKVAGARQAQSGAAAGPLTTT